MHPIEHLRYVARAHHHDPCAVAEEVAYALMALSCDPAGLLVGCRLVIEYHPDNVALWWVCARAVTSFEPRQTLSQCMELLQDYTGFGELPTAPVPWGDTLDQLHRQYPEAVHLLQPATTI